MSEPASQQVPPSHSGPKPPATPTPAVSGPLAALEAKFYEWFVYKAPYQLPVALTDFIVKFGPWITLVIGILMLPALFAVFTIGSVVGTVATAYGAVDYQPGIFYWLAMIVLLAQVIVMFVSIPMLLKQKRTGWLLLFYANLVSIVYGVINSFAYGYFAIGGLIWTAISAAIALYILFQIRRYYTK
ncbi:hypothetical protein EYC58_01345 [Candidatus Saccharibacteria bacterium]|nr:MAG: hypothetical protein EYC58_01345 [Candidatus Saccharibacteria bacterium]